MKLGLHIVSTTWAGGAGRLGVTLADNRAQRSLEAATILP